MKLSSGAELVEGHLVPRGRGFEPVEATPHERLALKAAGYRFAEAGDKK
jgi:hypothetical protein